MAPTLGQGFPNKWMRNGLFSKWMWNWFSKAQRIFLSLISFLCRVGRMDSSRSARSTDATSRLFSPSRCRPWSTRARPRPPSGWWPSSSSSWSSSPSSLSWLCLSRFRLACRGRDSSTAYLPVTVFIQDINDNPPIFQNPGSSTLSYNYYTNIFILILSGKHLFGICCFDMGIDCKGGNFLSPHLPVWQKRGGSKSIWAMPI